MNVLRSKIVQTIKTKFQILPEVRRVNDNDPFFDEKLFSLTRIEPVHQKETNLPLGRFIVSLPVCQRAGLIETNFPQNQRKFSSKNFDSNEIQSNLSPTGDLSIDTDLTTFVSSIFSELLEIFRNSSFYDRQRFSFYFDDGRKKAKWTKIEAKPSKILVEFSSPNIGKPLHAGHLRSTLLGQFISNIHQKFGHEVLRVNYLGDWGTQYGRLAVGFSRFGSEEELKKNPLKHLLDVYVKANSDDSLHDEAMKYFARMESGDRQILDLWKKFREVSIENLKKIYRLFDIKFDEYQSESEFSEKSKKILEQLEKFSFCQKRSDGVREAFLPSKFTDSTRDARFVVEKSDGTTLYVTRDIAALKFRLENFDFDRIFYVVDSTQSEHFRNVLAASKALNFPKVSDWDLEDFFVPFGRMMNFQTRKGNFHLLSDVLDDAKERTKEGLDRFLIRKTTIDQEKVESTIGKAYLILTDFSRPRRTDYIFSWHDISSKDGIAFLLLYCHARLSSLEKQVDMKIDWSVDVNLLKDRREQMLIQHLISFQDVLFDAYQTHEPNKLVKYLVRLAKCTNRALATLYVKDEEIQLAKARLLLYHMCRLSLKEGLELLGIEPLTRI